MTSERRRILRTVILWLCVATELIIVAAFVDVIGLGGLPWYGQAIAGAREAIVKEIRARS